MNKISKFINIGKKHASKINNIIEELEDGLKDDNTEEDNNDIEMDDDDNNNNMSGILNLFGINFKMWLIIIGIVCVIILGLFLYIKFSGSDSDGSSLKIDKTENIVTEINRLAELTTLSYAHDIVIYKAKEKIHKNIFGKEKINTDEIVLIVKGKVRFGFDLSELQEGDITFDSVSITLKLPPVQILDIITNPSDFEVFEESGKWSHEEITACKNEARAKLSIDRKAMGNAGLFTVAEKSGIEKLTVFLQALGFKKVTIEVAQRNDNIFENEVFVETLVEIKDTVLEDNSNTIKE
jgi:hypothetical protein